MKKHGLNFSGQGKPLAIILSDIKQKPNKKNMVYISEKEINNGLERINLKDMDDEFKFYLIPRENDRNVLYIIGASGSGKSYFIAQYIRNLLKFKPKLRKNIYLFSQKDEDEALDSIKIGNKRVVKRVVMDDSFASEPFDINQYKDCVFIFDDYDSIDKRQKNLITKIHTIINQSLMVGRKLGCECIISGHLGARGTETSVLLSEAQNIVWFKSLETRPKKYLLENYTAIKPKQIENLDKLKGRWICYSKTHPKCIISEREIVLIEDL